MSVFITSYLSALFHIHEVTDAHTWLVSLWLTAEKEIVTRLPPSPVLLSWLGTRDGCMLCWHLNSRSLDDRATRESQYKLYCVKKEQISKCLYVSILDYIQTHHIWGSEYVPLLLHNTSNDNSIHNFYCIFYEILLISNTHVLLGVNFVLCITVSVKH